MLLDRLLPDCITVNLSSTRPTAELTLFVEEARLKSALADEGLKASVLEQPSRITAGSGVDKKLNLRTVYLEVDELR